MVLNRLFQRLPPAARGWAVWLSRIGLLLLVIALLLPLGMRAGAHYAAGQQQLRLQLEGLYFNLFSGRLQLRQLRVDNDSETVLSIDELELNLAWLELLSGRIELESVRLQGGRTLIDQSQQLVIAGINIQALLQPETGVPESPKESGPGLAWGVSNIEIDELLFELRWPQWQKTLSIESMSLDRLASWQLDTQGLADLTVRLAEGQLRLNLQLALFGDNPQLTGSVEMEGIQLRWLNDWLVEQQLSLEGALAGRLSFSYPLDAESIDYRLSGALSVDQLRVESDANKQQLSLATLGMTGLVLVPDRFEVGQLAMTQLRDPQRDIELQQLRLSQIDGSLNQQLTIAAVELSGFNYPQQLVSFEQLLLHQLRFDFERQLGVERIEAKELFKPRSKLRGLVADMDFLIHFPSVQIDKIEALLPGEEDAGLVSVGQVSAANGEFLIAKTQAQNPDLQAAAPAVSENQTAGVQADSKEPEQAPPESAPLALVFEQIDYRNFSLSFIDTTIDPEYQITLKQLNINVGPYDSRQPERTTGLKLDAVLEGGGTVDLESQLLLAGEEIGGEAKVKIEAFDTRYGNYVVPRILGHRITQGHLDLSVDARIDNGYLDAENNLVLHKVAVRALNEQEAKQAEGAIGLPLGLALSMLSDNGKVDLDVPLKGPLNKLNVGLGDAIATVLYNSVGKAVLAYYSPLGMVLSAVKIANYVTKARFAPLTYSTEQAELDEQQRQHLAKVAKVLVDQPALKLVVCPRKGEEELTSLLNAGPEASAAASSAVVSLTGQRLDQLMQQRMTGVAQLLEAQGVDGKRLISCDLNAEPQAGPSKIQLAI